MYRNLFFCNTSTLSCLGNQVRLTKIIQQFYHFSSHSDKHHCDSCHASRPFLAAFWYLSQMTTEVKISICRSFARKVKFLSCLTQKRFKSCLWLAMRLATPSLSWGMPLKLKERNVSTKHNRLGNPNWREAGQLDIYKRGRGVELGFTEKQLQLKGLSGTRTRNLQIWSPTLWPLGHAFSLELGRHIIRSTALRTILCVFSVLQDLMLSH